MFNGDMDDLKQEASIGMVKAIKSFDVNNGTTFSTYATNIMINSIRTYLSKYYKLNNNYEMLPLYENIMGDNINIIYIKNDMYNILQKFKGLKYKIIKCFINYPNSFDVEIAKMVNCTPQYVGRIIKQYKYLLKNELEMT